jgi:mRNA-degrading endonuclease toxin of MazEF toxin-antitoxin module
MAQSVVKRGSVVLIRYPFTDLTGAKVRPALVLTPNHLLSRLEDVLCLFISSGCLRSISPRISYWNLGMSHFSKRG